MKSRIRRMGLVFGVMLAAFGWSLTAYAMPASKGGEPGVENHQCPVLLICAHSFSPTFHKFEPDANSEVELDDLEIISFEIKALDELTLYDANSFKISLKQHGSAVCLPAAHPDIPYILSGDPGVSITGDVQLDGSTLVTQLAQFNFDLAEANCQLSEGLVEVQAFLNASFPDNALYSSSWTFEIYEFQAPKQKSFRIDEFSPASGPPGTVVTVKGAGFVPELDGVAFGRNPVTFPGTQVMFAGQLISANYKTENELAFVVPQEAGCFANSVRLFNDPSITGDFGFLFPRGLTDEVTFSVEPCTIDLPELPDFPAIGSLSPNSGPPGTQVTVLGTGESGTGFVDGPNNSGSTVIWDVDPSINTLIDLSNDGTALPTTFVNGQELRFDVPADAECGRSYHLRVRGPGQTVFGVYSDAVEFQVVCGLTFSERKPAPEMNWRDVMPVISVRITSPASNGSVQPNSIEMILDQCPGLVFKTTSGAQFVGNTFFVELAGLANTPCLLPDGPVSITVTAEDSLGNEGTTTWSFNIQWLKLEVDPEDPVVDQNFSITALPAENLTLDDADYRWYADFGEGFDELTNNAGFPLTGPQRLANFDQPSTFAIRVSAIGNQGAFCSPTCTLPNYDILAQAELTISVEDGPSGSPAPSPSPSPERPNLMRLLDSNDNDRIDQAELQQAIRYWIEGRVVPGTLQVLDDCWIKAVAQLWVTNMSIQNGASISCAVNNSTVASVNMAQALHVQALGWQAPHSMQRTLIVSGQNIASVQLQVYDLNGQLQLQRHHTGSQLRFALLNRKAQPLSNGVYLFVVEVRGSDGTTWRSGIRKMMVLR